MPLIQKPNYNQIFASQAPDQDKPAVFNNYPEGWGPESRPNNGKPTIKGFNYLQQASDLKDLWILQNGACLPYDESIEYTEGAPVLKDGVIQYKTASGFSPTTSDAQNIKNSLGGSVQDFIDDQLSKTTLLLNISVTPEMYGAKGNGIDDDTAAVTAWWLSQFVHKQARGKYKVNFGSSGVLLNLTSSLEIDMVGAEFIPTAIATYMFKIQCETTGYSLVIKGGKVDCADMVARPLEVFGDGRLAILDVSNNEAYNMKETGQGLSAHGFRASIKSDVINIYNNIYKDISRVTYSAMVVACQAIVVHRVDSICSIFNNRIENVQTVEGAADADGIVVFSENRLIVPSEPQTTSVRIFNNKIKDCAGRFVKLQCPAQVYGNDFRSETGGLVTEFRAIDAQFGGVDVFSNEWRLASGVTGASTATFCLQDLKGDTGSEDNVGSIVSNKLYLDQEIRYLAHVRTVGGKHVIKVKDNVIKGEDGILKVEDMVRLTIESASAIGSLALSIESNELTLGTSALLLVSGAGFGSPELNSKLALTIADNRPKNVLSGGKIIETGANAANPYLGDVLIKDNGSQGLAFAINARGIDVSQLRVGNDFYYTQVDSSQGLAGTPAGYNRYVHVKSNFSSVELSRQSDGKKAVRYGGAGANWYEYTGTPLV